MEPMGGQLYINLVAGDAEVIEIASCNVKGVLRICVRRGLPDLARLFFGRLLSIAGVGHGWRIDGHSSNHAIGRDHTRDVQSFDYGIGKSRMLVVTLIETAS